MIRTNFNYYKNFIRGVVILLCLFLTHLQLYGQMVKVEIEKLSISSKIIIKGEVINKWSEFEDNKRNIVTYIELKVNDVIKGEAGQTFTIVIPGGIVGEIGEVVSHTPHFNIGEETVVFISDDYKNRPTVTEWVQGKYSVINDKVFYESQEIQANDFVNALKNFVETNEQEKIEINLNNNLKSPKPDKLEIEGLRSFTSSITNH